MANSRSALKRVRQTATRSERNRVLKSRIRTFRKRVSTAVEAKDAEAAQAAHQSLSSAADKAAKRGAIHKNAASRLKARSARDLAALSS
ncbi:MAG: 30S ribosomal protein S20 [Verrucomicrobiota bacterium]